MPKRTRYQISKCKLQMVDNNQSQANKLRRLVGFVLHRYVHNQLPLKSISY